MEQVGSHSTDINRCTYWIATSKDKIRLCDGKRSDKDPEHLFCYKHRRCVYVTVEKNDGLAKKKVHPKYRDYTTFKVSCIEYALPENVTVADLFKRGNLKILADK